MFKMSVHWSPCRPFPWFQSSRLELGTRHTLSFIICELLSSLGGGFRSCLTKLWHQPAAAWVYQQKPRTFKNSYQPWATHFCCWYKFKLVPSSVAAGWHWPWYSYLKSVALPAQSYKKWSMGFIQSNFRGEEFTRLKGSLPAGNISEL